MIEGLHAGVARKLLHSILSELYVDIPNVHTYIVISGDITHLYVPPASLICEITQYTYASAFEVQSKQYVRSKCNVVHEVVGVISHTQINSSYPWAQHTFFIDFKFLI